MSQFTQLKEAYAATSQSDWQVKPLLRPDLDNDPMAEYVIESVREGLTRRYFTCELDSLELADVHLENQANAEFIALAHNLMPDILASLERLEQMESLAEGVLTVRCVVACTNALGEPDLHFVKVRCSKQAYDDGEHYETAKRSAKDEGYSPYVAFDENDTAGKFMMPLFNWDTATTFIYRGNLDGL